MKKYFKIAVLFLLYFIFFQTAVFPQNFLSTNNYSENILENGIKVFILEDFSIPTINVKYTVSAGFSAQNKNNTGFFKLYSKLFKTGYTEEENLENLNFSEECNSDISAYSMTVTPISLEKSLESLAKHAFNSSFTDKNIKAELDLMKNEVMQYSSTPASFINAGIDSRIFSSEPWKFDSGIYPALFSKTTPSQARTILEEIAKKFYTPQNSCIFISGCVKKEAALELIEKTFGIYKRSAVSQKAAPPKIGNEVHKFVFYDKQFSKDFTQIVVQYTSVFAEQCDVAQAAFENDFSYFKTQLFSEKKLNIRAPEYINIASNHMKNSSRLIVQSLLEKNKLSPVEQAELFLLTCKDAIKSCPEKDFLSAKKSICEDFLSITESSSIFMNYLSKFEPLAFYNEHQTLAQNMLDRPKRISEINTADLKNSLSFENPFIFVLVNSDSYNKYKNEFKKAGFQAINSKNASWFSEKLAKNSAKKIETKNQAQQNFENSELKEFISKNKNSISKFTLSNGIPVVIKKQETTSKATFAISISGGKFSTLYSPQFQQVMTEFFVSNIQSEVKKLWEQGFLEVMPKVYSEILDESNIIAMESSAEDISACIKAAGKAIIFGEIQPALADSYVYSVATQQRISNANPINQLYGSAANYLFTLESYKNSLYNTSDSIEKVKYFELLAAYTNFLNAELYSFAIVGNIDAQKVLPYIEATFSILNCQKKSKYSSISEKYEKPNFPKKAKRLNVKLQHLFYTDISTEDAGPMPAILVPTKNFCDPVQFWLPMPTLDSSEDFLLFSAICFRFFEYMKTSLTSQASEIKILPPSKRYNAVAYTFINVSHTKKVDFLFENCVLNFTELLAGEENAVIETKKIKDSWILNTFSNADSNFETAKFLLSEANPEEYLNNCEKVLNASPKDFKEVAEKYLSPTPLLRLYSSESID